MQSPRYNCSKMASPACVAFDASSDPRFALAILRAESSKGSTAPNQDGINNLLAYALHLDPMAAGVTLANALSCCISEAGPNGHLILTLNLQDPLPGGITYIVEGADTLTSISWAAIATATSLSAWNGPVTVTQDPPLGGYRNVHVHDIINQGSVSTRFVRLRITMP